MRVAIITASIYPEGKQPEMMKYTKARLEYYCRLRKYDLFYVDKFITDAKCVRGRHKWNGIYLIRWLLNNNKYDAYVWMDDDIFICDLNKKIEDYCNQTNKKMIFSRDLDWSADTAFMNMVNTGIYILKDCNISRNFINRAWDLRNFENHGSRYRDQATFNMLIINQFGQYCDIQSLGELQSLITGNITTNSNPLCIHFAGSSLKDKYNNVLRQNIYTTNSQTLINNIINNWHHKIIKFGAKMYYLKEQIKTNHNI